jgi:hypothetical protein
MLRIPIDLKASKIPEFLDYLKLELQFERGWTGQGSFRKDGRFEERVVGKLQGAKEEDGEVLITVIWNLDGSIEPISAEVMGKFPADWEAAIEQAVHRALIGTINAHRKRYFFNFSAAYMGPLLDGEYYVSGFRFAPALFPDDAPTFIERVVYLGLHSEGVDQLQAGSLGRVKAATFFDLLSCFLDVGFYSIPPEHRWVRLGNNEAARYQLGFHHPMKPPPHKKPKKGLLCPLGQFEKVNREEMVEPFYHERLRLPDDIRKLFKIYENLRSHEKQAFLGAARLFTLGLTAGRRYPTVRMAYSVAAIDALSAQHTAQAFTDFVREYCPEAPEEIVKDSYGRIRSAHFHEGAFPGGEYEPFRGGFFSGPDDTMRRNFRLNLQLIMWNVLIRWLLSKEDMSNSSD